MIEVALRALQLAQALDVERVEVDALPAAGGPGQLGREPAMMSPVMRTKMAITRLER